MDRPLVAILLLLTIGLSCKVNHLFYVTTFVDAVDADLADDICRTTAGECSLRAAIQQANANDRVFKIVLESGSYVLSLAGADEDAAAVGDLDVEGDLTIVGKGAHRTIIDAGEIDRVFHALGTSSLKLEKLQIQNGFANRADGGGLLVDASAGAELVDVTVNSNRGLNGGGVRVEEGGTLAVSRSAVVWNQADRDGGGFSSDGTLTIESSTLGINIAGGSGGGLEQGSFGTAVFSGATLAQNEAPLGSNLGGTMAGIRLGGSIVAWAGGGGSSCSGAPISLGYNLSDDVSCDLVSPGDLMNLDPQLRALDINEGGTPIYALQPSSPAINEGDPSVFTDTDQFGKKRPVSGVADIGAHEYDFLDAFALDVWVAGIQGSGAVLFNVESDTLATPLTLLLQETTQPAWVLPLPAQKRVVVGWTFGPVKLIDVFSNQILWTWTPPVLPLAALEVHPDGSKIWAMQSLAGGCIWTIHASTGTLDSCLTHTFPATSFAITPNALTLYAEVADTSFGSDLELHVYNLTANVDIGVLSIEAALSASALTDIRDMTVSPFFDRLYLSAHQEEVFGDASTSLHAIDTVAVAISSSVTHLSTFPNFVAEYRDLAVNPSTMVLWALRDDPVLPFFERKDPFLLPLTGILGSPGVVKPAFHTSSPEAFIANGSTEQLKRWDTNTLNDTGTLTLGGDVAAFWDVAAVR